MKHFFRGGKGLSNDFGRVNFIHQSERKLNVFRFLHYVSRRIGTQRNDVREARCREDKGSLRTTFVLASPLLRRSDMNLSSIYHLFNTFSSGACDQTVIKRCSDADETPKLVRSRYGSDPVTIKTKASISTSKSLSTSSRHVLSLTTLITHCYYFEHTWLILRQRTKSASARVAGWFGVAPGLGRTMVQTRSAVVRPLFESCSAVRRRAVEALSKTTRRSLEAVPNQSRSGLEGESKGARRVVEPEGARTKVELALTQPITRVELGMNYQTTKDELATSLQRTKDELATIQEIPKRETRIRQESPISNVKNIPERYCKGTGKVLNSGGKGTGEVLESYQRGTTELLTCSRSVVALGRNGGMSQVVSHKEGKTFLVDNLRMNRLILRGFRLLCEEFRGKVESIVVKGNRGRQIALKQANRFARFLDASIPLRYSSRFRIGTQRYDGRGSRGEDIKMLMAYSLQLIALFCVLFSTLVFTQAVAQVSRGELGTYGRSGHVLQGEVRSAADGAIIEGATVSTGKKTVHTGANGVFSIGIDKSHGSLIIKHIGFKEQSVAYDNTTTFLKIQLQAGSKEIDEVEVVSTGYQKIPKERATGSFDFVNNEALNQTISGNIIDRIELQVPGLLVDRNEGAPDKFLIRGRSSIYADVQPLIVLDGFPYDGEIGNINLNDIESVTVLKDAAAASIWGARAGNGVIVITTKIAKQDRPTIGFNSTLGIQHKPDLSTISQISSTDYIDLEKFLFEKGHYANDEQYDEWNYGHPPFTPVIELLRKKRDGDLNTEYVDQEIEKYKQYDVNKDIIQKLYRIGFEQQYAFNLGQKIGLSNYIFSAGYDNNKSTVVGQGGSRLNLRFNMRNDLSTWFKIENALAFSNTKSLLGNNQGYGLHGQAPNTLGGNKAIYPYARLIDDSGAPTLLYLDNNEAYVKSMLEKGLDWSYSPLEEIKRRRTETNVRDILLNTGMQIIPYRDILFSVKYQFQDQVSDNNTIYLPESYYARAYSNSFAQQGSDGKLSFPVPQQGIWDRTSGRRRSHQGRIQADWNKTWNDAHELYLLGGWEIRNSVTFFSGDRKYGYNEDFYGVDPRINYDTEYTLYNNSFLKQQIISNNTIQKTTDNFISLYFNGAYTFRNRYHLSFSGRKDEANLFGLQTNQKGTPLWSLGAKWNISEEAFYHSPLIPKLALRATYGKSGNIARNVSAIPTITLASSAYTTPLITAGLNGFPNHALRWEKVNVLNLGLDFSFSNNKFQASVDYFDKVSEDLLGESPLDPTLGRATFFGNVAKMQAKGLDFKVNAKIIDRSLDWDLSFIYGYSNPKISAYYMPVSTTGNTYLGKGNMVNPVLGRPVFALYGLKWEGLNPENGNPIGLLGTEKSEDYTNIYAKTAFEDLTYHGSVQPTTYGSMINTFRYKGVGMAIALSYKAGYVIRKPALNYTNLFTSWTGHGDYAVRWQKTGDERVTDVPSLVYPQNIPRDVFYQYADIHILRGDHIRLENIRLDYDLPLNKSNKLPFKSVKCFFFLKSNQTWWIANNKGIDPYFNNSPKPGAQWSFGLISNL
ncbi:MULTISPECIES: SusC/RagA family TonB-linked outer membrane protein [Sphingobacterium]|uniref:SusC/RagA family TonB-linked outer membrane protein n=1 Tax=Sphingobacterium TaxID=28453 RepID=UPI0013DCA6DD|nr:MULTISPECIES: SusC/RagA family TonB-linked outer membrane protein [unclassified Sphingobacterium]